MAVAPGLCWHFVNEEGPAGFVVVLGEGYRFTFRTASRCGNLGHVVAGFWRFQPGDMFTWLGHVFSEHPAVLLPDGLGARSAVPWRPRCRGGGLSALAGFLLRASLCGWFSVLRAAASCGVLLGGGGGIVSFSDFGALKGMHS